MTSILVLAEHDRGVLASATLEAVTAACSLVATSPCWSVAITTSPAELGDHGATTVYVADHELLADFGPEAWAQALALAIHEFEPDVVIAPGTSKGNEVMAGAAARLDLPFVANCTTIEDDAATMIRVQWGGSLLEEASLDADIKLVSIAHHSIEASVVGGEASSERFDVDLDGAVRRTIVVDREVAETGVTLATAPVVVGGGRGVGSPDAFAPLEALAAALGGRVGCSRAVTNNGWRPHADQVGQTGTRIAPEIYIASGISGAIQHWVGAMASKTILAINTDPEANMVTKADYAVIGDLHTVIPAITAEIERRRS
ncbi:MAG: electron transfer flavoprotein subunit alpha/FixB family protein [Acidimicrobiales bacterium]